MSKNREQLYNKYRPQTFSDVIEQDAIKQILSNQINTNDVKAGYLFCGPPGEGKTTCARIFAREINNGLDTYFEMDAASNSSVEDIKIIRAEARLGAINSDYKIFIIDECHSLSTKAWDPLLKILEETPKGTIFIFCTTEPRKVNAAILSRVQRFDFRRISFQGILNRLKYIIDNENKDGNIITYTDTALDYITKLADGGMRDAVKFLDQCLAYDHNLTYESVCSSLNVISYELLFELLNCILRQREADLMRLVNRIYMMGLDLKYFIEEYSRFILDIQMFTLLGDDVQIMIPNHYLSELHKLSTLNQSIIKYLLEDTADLKANCKYEDKPKQIIMISLLKQCRKVSSC